MGDIGSARGVAGEAVKRAKRKLKACGEDPVKRAKILVELGEASEALGYAQDAARDKANANRREGTPSRSQAAITSLQAEVALLTEGAHLVMAAIDLLDCEGSLDDWVDDATDFVERWKNAENAAQDKAAEPWKTKS